MTTSERFYIPFTQLFTNLGVIGAGWKLKTYATGTTTPKATYSNEALTVPNPVVIVADSAGRIGVDMWVADRSLYKLVMTDENDVVIQTTDPVDSSSGGSIIPFDPLPAAYWGTTSGGPTSYTLNPALVAITAYSFKQCFFIDFNVACNDSPTLNVNNLGAQALKKYNGLGTKVAIQAGGLQAQRYVCIDDGVDFVILNTKIQTLGSIQTFTSSGTWTKPIGCIASEVWVIGGGGGSGGAQPGVNMGNASGGGGGGGCAYKFITSGLGVTETITIGAGGAAGSTTTAGGAGETSSFGAHCSATGGGGSSNANGWSGAQVGGKGGVGGVGSGGSVNLVGGAGVAGGRIFSVGGLGGSGGAGAGQFGGGGAVQADTAANAGVAGVAGTANTGGGAAGAIAQYNAGTSFAGAAGGSGLIVVKEYY